MLAVARADGEVDLGRGDLHERRREQELAALAVGVGDAVQEPVVRRRDRDLGGRAVDEVHAVDVAAGVDRIGVVDHLVVVDVDQRDVRRRAARAEAVVELGEVEVAHQRAVLGVDHVDAGAGRRAAARRPGVLVVALVIAARQHDDRPPRRGVVRAAAGAAPGLDEADVRQRPGLPDVLVAGFAAAVIAAGAPEECGLLRIGHVEAEDAPPAAPQRREDPDLRVVVVLEHAGRAVEEVVLRLGADRRIAEVADQRRVLAQARELVEVLVRDERPQLAAVARADRAEMPVVRAVEHDHAGRAAVVDRLRARVHDIAVDRRAGLGRDHGVVGAVAVRVERVDVLAARVAHGLVVEARVGRVEFDQRTAGLHEDVAVHRVVAVGVLGGVTVAPAQAFGDRAFLDERAVG